MLISLRHYLREDPMASKVDRSVITRIQGHGGGIRSNPFIRSCDFSYRRPFPEGRRAASDEPSCGSVPNLVSMTSPGG